MNRPVQCVSGKALHTFPDAKRLLPCGHPAECVLRDYEEDICYICLLEQNVEAILDMQERAAQILSHQADSYRATFVYIERDGHEEWFDRTMMHVVELETIAEAIRKLSFEPTSEKEGLLDKQQVKQLSLLEDK